MTPKEIKQLAKSLGGEEQLAVKVGVRYNTVYRWIHKGIKPHHTSVKAMEILNDELDRSGESQK